MNWYALLAALACYYLPFRLLWDTVMREGHYRHWTWRLRTYVALSFISMLAGHAFLSMVNPRVL